MKMMTKRVFIGLCEICNLVAIYSRELKKLKYIVKTIIIHKNKYFLNERYDDIIESSIIKKFKFLNDNLLFMFIYSRIILLFKFIKNINNDIFIFVFNRSFLPFRIDYLILKILNKKIISNFCGCDIKHWKLNEQMAKKYKLISGCTNCKFKSSIRCSLLFKKILVKMSEKFSDIILTSRYHSQLLTKPFYFYWIPIELNKYKFKIPKNKIPIIVHAPSDRAIKGTKYILEALNKLKKEGYKFKLILLENQPNEKVREVLSKADIVIDQLFSIGPANLALEAMASGCAVLTGYNEEFFPAMCPVIPISKENIYEKIKYLLENKKEIYKYAIKGRKYVERYHDSKKVVKNIIDIIEGKKKGFLVTPKV